MIDNMDFDDFDEYGFKIFPIIAFGKNPYAGKNSKIQRSLRARAQRRDRYGRFAFMFGGMGFDYFDNNGNIQTALGTYVGAADQDGYLQIFVENDPILGTGVFNAKENNASQYIANLSPEQLKKAGIEVGKDASGKAITARDKKIIPTIAELHRQDAPEGWTKNDDGTYTSEDNAYKITPPAGKSKSWTLQELDDNGDAKDKGTTHRGFGAALKDVNERDTKALLSSDDNQKLAELQDDLAAAEDTETDGDEIAEDQKQSEIDSIQKKIDDILNKGELDETAAEEAPAEQEEDVQDDGQAPKAKKQAAVGVEDTRANTPGNLETRWGRQLGPAMKRAQGAITLFMQQNKANNRPATTKEVSDLFTAIDNAFLDRGQSMRYDADVDAFQELSKEYFGLDADIARAEKAGNTQLVSDLKGRKKEVGTQVSALQQAISTRYQNRAPLADEPTVDVSTNFPEVTDFVAPSYKKARGKGRPKGTGKNQIAAKKAAEEQQKAPEATEDGADQEPVAEETPAGPTPEERKAEAEARKAEAEARKAEAEADKAEAEVPAPVEEEATPAPAAKKQGAVADAPETGTTKTGTRSRVQNSKELDNAPAGTVVHRFSGNGTFDDSAFGTAGRDLLGEPSYIDSIIKGEDGEWYRISPKTGNPESKALNARALRLNANDSYGSSMVFDKPDDGSTPETMYAQAAKGKADAEAARAARKTETAEPAVAETPEAPTAEEAKPEEVAPAQPKGMTPAEYSALLENPFLDSEQVAPAVIDKYDNEAGELRALFDSGADGAALVAKAREISPAFVAEDDFEALQNKRINAGQRPSGADNNRVSLHNRELGALGRLSSDTPESRAELAKLPSKEKDAYGKVVGDKIYGMELDALPAGARIKSIPHTRADGSMGYGYLTKQEDGTWTYDSDGLVATNIKAIADRNRTAYAGSPEPEAAPAVEEVAPTEEVTPDVTPDAENKNPLGLKAGDRIRYYNMVGMYGNTRFGTIKSINEEAGTAVIAVENPSASSPDFVRSSLDDILPAEISADAESVELDPSGDLKKQIANAIKGGKLLSFSFNGENRLVIPVNIDDGNDRRGIPAKLKARDSSGVTKSFSFDKIKPVEAETVAPVSDDATPAQEVELDLNGDVKAQIEKAIADGNDIAFYYQGSGTEPTRRVVTPDSVWNNPQTGQDNLYGLQQGEDKKKNFTISKMSNAPEVDKTTGIFKEYNPAQRMDPSTSNAGEDTPLTELGWDPEEEITIYRGVPEGVTDINPGDWVTDNPQLAKDYAGDGDVISMKVKAKDLLTDKSSGVQKDGKFIEEMVYRPENSSQDVTPTSDVVAEPQKSTPSSMEELKKQLDEQAKEQRQEIVEETGFEPIDMLRDEPTSGTSELEADTADAPTTEEEVAEADAIEPTAEETAAEAGADLDLITTRTTDEDYADEAYLPTEEQRNVIDAAVSELDVSVQALAGSGKTSTLVLAAKQLLKYHPNKKILYIAFNKSVQLEAGERMPKENTEARTGDSLAVTSVDKKLTDKLNKGHSLPKDVADDLGIPSFDKNREDIAIDIQRVIEKYSISDSDDIGQEHFDAAGVEFNSKNLAYAQMYWADLNDPQGKIKYTFSHNTKIWALTRPDLSQYYGGAKSFNKADVIFFDEAQDINPVMAKVIRDQTIQKVYVGDSNQAIYGFRGADDELDKVQTDITLPMTRTFRFGQTLAGPGNRMLSLLKAKYKIIGAGKTEGEVVDAGSMNDADAVLTRTNAGRFGAIIEELDKGRVVGVTEKDKKDAESMIATVRYLKNGGRRPYNFHEDLDGYKSWNQVEADVKRGKAAAKVEMIYNLTNLYSPDQLSVIMSRVVVLPEKAGDLGLPALDFTPNATGDFADGIKYVVSDLGDGKVRLSISNKFFKFKATQAIKDTQLKPNGFTYNSDDYTWNLEGTPAEIQDAANAASGRTAADTPDVDVIVMTAHKSKGLEWKRVRIADDFTGPEPDAEGKLVFPEKQEMNLAYVALTRGEEAIDPGSLAWVYDYTSDEDEDPTTESRGLPEGVTQAGQPAEASEAAEEAPAEPETAPAAEEVVEDVVEDVAEPVGTEENPATPAEPVEAPAEEQPAGPSEQAPEALAPVEKKADAPLIRNEDQSNLDPAPAETTDTGVEGVSNDPQVIADTYDNKDLVDALVTAVQNDEPGINIEGENGNTAIVPVENVRDALQKQGTNTNDVIDEALGEPEVQSVPAEILSTDDSKPSENTVKRFQLNNLLATREVPKENKDAIDLISTDPSATDEQIDWAISILDDQPDLLSTPKAQLPQLSKDIVDVQVDPGQVMGLIESIYPNAKKLSATGDLIVHEEAYYDKKTKTNFVHQIGVVRTADEKFYVYGREINLATGESRSRRLSPFAHSPEALNNYIITQTVIKRDRKNKTLWFNKANKRSHSYFIQDEGQITLEDGTTEPIHRREEPVHRDLVEAIRAAISQEDLSNQVIQAIYQDIARFGVGETALRKIQTDYNLDETSFAAIIDTLNAHESTQYKVRSYGVYVSADFEIPVEKGDVGWHRNEKTGEVRYGIIIRRQGTHSSKIYGYSDYVTFAPLVGSDASGNPIYGGETNITSKNFTIDKTAAGTDGSERINAARDLINIPVSKPAVDTPAPKPPMEPAKPKVEVTIDRSEPSKPTVEVNGEAKPATANRTTSIKNFNPEDVDAAQLQAGDFFMTMDPEMGIPRLAEVVTTEFDDEAGKFKVTAIIPDNNTTATAFEQEWDVDANNGLSGQRMIAYRRPAPEPTVASDDTVQELLRAMRAHDVSFLSAEDAAQIGDFTSRYINGEELTQEEVDALLGKLAETPLRNAAPTPVATAIQAAQDIVDADADSGDRDELQNVVDEAKIKESELPETPEETGTPKLSGYTVTQNERGVYYPNRNILRGSDDFNRLRRGEVVPPALPFVLVNTPNGDVTYYDGNGVRRWGQFGAAGAVLRTKNDDGSYSYFLAKRTSTTSTDPNKWSVPGGAHDSLADSESLGTTAKREMYEELGIDVDAAKTAGNVKKELAPDWAYDYSILEVDKSATDNLDLSSGEVADTGWFTADEIRDMFNNGELHSGFDADLLEEIFNVGDAPADETAAPDSAEESSILNLTGYKQVGLQGGSNPGGTFEGPDGKKYYVKFQKSDMHASNEVAAAALYNRLGVTAPSVGHGEMDGKTSVTHSEIIERSGATPKNSADLRKKVQEGFAIDAWLANWDAVLNDNTISDTDGNPVRVDVGGSLLYRAQGGPKGDRFGDVVGELDSLRDPRMNSTAAAIYGSMTDEEIKASASKLLDISEEDIDSIIDEAFAGVSPSYKATVDGLKATLKARRKNILDRFGLSESDTPDADAPTPAEAVSEQVEEVVPEFDASSIQLGDVIPNSANIFQEMADKDIRYGSREVSIYANGGVIVVGRSIFSDNKWKLLGRNYVAGENIAVPDGVNIDGYMSSQDLQKLFDLNLKNEEAAGRKNFGVIAGDIRDNVRDQSTINSVYGGVIPALAFELGATRYSDGTTINNGTETYRVSSDSSTLSSTFTDVRTSRTFSGKEMAAKVASGQEFRFGKLAQDMTTGDDISPEWLQIAKPGQSIFLTETSRYLDNDYDRVTTLTLGEDGTWRDVFGRPMDTDALKKRIEKTYNPTGSYSYMSAVTRIGTSGIPEADLPNLVRSNNSSLVSRFSSKVYTNGTQTIASAPTESRETGSTTTWYRVTNPDGTPYRGPKSLPDNVVKERISYEEVEEFFRGPISTDPRNVASVGDTINKDNVDAVDTLLSGANVRVKTTLPMDGEPLELDVDMVYDGSNFSTSSGFALSKDAVISSIKKGDGTVTLLDKAETSGSGSKASPAEVADFKSFLSKKLGSSSSEYTERFGPEDMSSQQILDATQYIEENGIAEREVAKAVLLYSSKFNNLPQNERDAYANAVGTVYSPGSSRKNRSLGEVFSQLDDAIEKSADKGEGREQSSSKMEVLVNLFPELQAKPKVVPSKDNLDTSEGANLVIYRGNRPTRVNGKNVRASTLQKDWAFGDRPFWGGDVGGHAYGHGMYYSDQIGTARSYAGLGWGESDRGRILSAQMNPDAKILTTDEGSRSKRESIEELQSAGYIWYMSYLMSRGFVPGTDEFNAQMNKGKKYILDQSFTPTLRGYDVLKVYRGNEHFWIVVNRGAMTVVDPTPKRGSN